MAKERLRSYTASQCLAYVVLTDYPSFKNPRTVTQASALLGKKNHSTLSSEINHHLVPEGIIRKMHPRQKTDVLYVPGRDRYFIEKDIEKFVDLFRSQKVKPDDMNDDEKVIDQIIDFGTNDEGCSFIVDHYSPEDSYILFENLTTAHRVYHFFKDRGYRVEGLHTGHGCVTEISKTDFKTDLEDATKLARMCKDHFTGRREYALAHFADIDSMKAKELCRVMNDCSEQRDKLNLRIQAYMDLFDIHLPKGLKNVYSNKAMAYLKSLNHPALTIMVEDMASAMAHIETARDGLESLFRDNEDVQNLMSIKGIALQTAATIYTAIDGIERFETPESLVSYFGLKITRHESGGDRDLHGHINKRGDPLVRKYLANVVVKHSIYYPDSDLAGFYKRKKEVMPHWKAVTAAMRKLVCIIWAMLTRHQVYRFSSPVKA